MTIWYPHREPEEAVKTLTFLPRLGAPAVKHSKKTGGDDTPRPSSTPTEKYSSAESARDVIFGFLEQGIGEQPGGRPVLHHLPQVHEGRIITDPAGLLDHWNTEGCFVCGQHFYFGLNPRNNSRTRFKIYRFCDNNCGTV